ncbi:MAG: SpoIIE family protein phosphatase [Bacteroidia bacterium]|nr:SpoIIE family protein phosphatase [Bacteroidia bacterium]
MIRFNSIILVSIILLRNANLSIAQQVRFTNYSTENGLSQEQVLAICQDDNKVLWLGTSGGGITLFDSKHFTYFTDKDGLADNVIYDIKKGNDGTMLIGTNNGLSVYKAGKFTNYTTAQGLTQNRIFAIHATAKGYLLATARGVCLFANNIITPLKIHPALDTANVFCIAVEDKFTLWYGTLGNGAFKVNNKVQNFTPDNSGLEAEIYSIVEYNGAMYLGCTNFLFKYNNLKIEKQYISINKNFISPHNYLFKNSSDELWIATDNGLYKYNGKTYKFYTKKDGLTDDAIWKIYEDVEHNIWLGSSGNGLSKYSSEKTIIYSKQSGIVDNQITAILTDNKNNLLIGTIGGLSILNNKTTTNYTSKNWNSNGDISVLKMYNNQLLIGTTFGLHTLLNNKITSVKSHKNRSYNVVNDILINTKNEIIVATEGGIATIINNAIVPLNGISAEVKLCRSIYQDKNNTYWIGTDDGLFSYNGTVTKHYTNKDGCTTKPVQQVTGNKMGTLFLASGEGIYKYDGKTFTAITEKNDLTSNDVRSLGIDNNGALWVGFQKGVDKITFATNNNYTIKHYDITECMNKAIYIDELNHIYVGTQNGLVLYQPEYDVPNTTEPKLHIRSVDMFSRAVNWKTVEEVDSVSNDGIPVNLTLPYNKNYLTINYVGVSHTTPQKVRYQYMLKGLDKTWLPITQKTQVEYANLPFGKYEFLLKAENGEGVWNSTPLSYTFEIEPPFWRTWWAYSLLAAVVLSLLYSYYNIRRASVKIGEQNIIIAEKNRNITDSINYAKRLQEGFLASEEILNDAMPQHFVLFKPKDIVSGDFYWCQHLTDRTFIACADSTGHGIPGAFMSLIGINMLNECFHSKQLYSPEAILEELRRLIILALNPKRDEKGGKDGMDMTLLSIPKKPNAEGRFIITYAGAQNSLYIVNGQTQELTEHKTDKQPVAYYPHMQPFILHSVEANKGDTLYMTTDGYPDQFGGEKGKKFMTKKLKELFVANSHLPINLQHMVLNNAFEAWKGKLDQVDDVTVIGIKL